MRVEAEQDRARAAPFGFAQRTPHKWRASTRCDADHGIAAFDAAIFNRARAGLKVVFSAFDRLPDRCLSARDDALNQLGIRPEGRRTFAGIEHSQSTARAGTDIEQPSAPAKRSDDQFDSLLNLLSLRQQGRGDQAIFT